MKKVKNLYWQLRERLRNSPLVGKAAYLLPGIRYWMGNRFANQVKALSAKAGKGQGVALCVRIRDEAPNLRELVEYYLAAGVSHIFFYEARSVDDFHTALDPFVKRGVVSLIEDWPTVPVSPAAEHDCILRAIGRFAWVGFVDADEFVVIRDKTPLDQFLQRVPERYPALAMHWRFYGSSGHKTRPNLPVILAYRRCQAVANRHVKVFIRPERARHCRNSHSWYFSGFLSTAVDEKGRRVYGSFGTKLHADDVWINHYYHKSAEEFAAKGNRASILDAVGISFNSRTKDRGEDYEKWANAVEDLSAVEYHRALCRLQDCSICAALPAQMLEAG